MMKSTTPDKQERLRACPFCGGTAELDYSRHFRAMSSGNLEKAVAIYCLECSADMTLCHSDHREYDAEQLAEILVENWNHRADAASRSIPAGEDVELVAEWRRVRDEYRGTPQWLQNLSDQSIARLSSLSSELEQVRAENARLMSHQIGWAYQDQRWDKDRWHLCQEEPRAFEGREVRPVFLGDRV